MIGSTAVAGDGTDVPSLWLLDGVENVAVPMEYFPVESGRKWMYQIRREVSFVLPDHSAFVLWEGRWKERFEEGSERVGSIHPAFVHVLEFREVARGSGLVREGTLSSDLSVEPDQVLVHAMRIEGLKEFPDEPQILATPVPMFMTPRAGQARTEQRRVSFYGLDLVADTLSMGLDEARTTAGTFKDCIKVSLVGRMSGAVATFPELGEVDVSVEETQWFARRVGLVKQVRNLRGHVTRDDVGTTEVFEEITKELTAYSKPRD